MAKIGLKYPCFALATEAGSAISYSGGAVIAKGITANISIETNDVKLYADDVIVETDKSFSGGTISLNVDDLTDAVKVALLGYTEGAEADAILGSKNLSAGGSTTPATVGVGFYGKRVRGGAYSWRAIWLKKVQFAEPADEFSTKGETTEFQTATLEGTIMLAADELWKEEATFSSEAAAIAWLNGKAGISTSASNNITALALADGTLTPTFAATTYLYSCAIVAAVATTITATFAAGTAKVYVDGVYNQSLTTEDASASIPVADGTNKLVEIVVQESGKSPVTYKVLVQNAVG